MASNSNYASEDPAQQDQAWREYVESLHGADLPFEAQWDAFQCIFSLRTEENGPPVVWTPDKTTRMYSNVYASMQSLGIPSFADFHAWSVRNKPAFWEHVLDRLGIVFTKPPETILDITNGVEQPRWFSGAEMNIIDSCFTAAADKAAIISRSEDNEILSVITYGELERLVNRIANGIREHGIEPETPIALYMPMTVECVAAYLGIIRARCVAVSIADSFSAIEINTRMRIAGARHIITVDHYIRAGKTMTMYDKVLEADVPVAIVIPSKDSTFSLRNDDLSWDDLLSSEVSSPSVAGDPYCPINILFSSGTTGEPKAIPWTHLTPLKSAMDGYYHHDIHTDDVVAWPTNIGWMMGPWLIYASLINGATMALYEGAPHTSGFARFVQQAGVSMLGVIPSLVRVWRTGHATEDADWSRIRLFSSTGEPSNRYDQLWLMSRTGHRAPVIEYLGGTEIGGGHLTCTVLQPASPAAFTTLALGTDCVILDEKGQPVDEGHTGELFLIPPSIGLSQIILNRDHHEVYYADCPSDPHGKTLRRHGDQTLRLHKGFYRAQGRADDTMNLGGIKISSLELERVIESHEAIYESAAVAIQPEGEGAEQLVVFAVLDQEISSETLRQDLKTMVARQLNPLFKIYDLIITQDLPRTASNKLMRRTLRTRYQEIEHK
ncbi:MAG: AMP-binding protein [Gemmatimonadota bacterium]|nr:AMP-binding protein [Gemmatimonadota bacterium]